MKYKEQAYIDFMRLIKNSWTWSRITADERARFVEVVNTIKLSGTYDQRHEQLRGAYAGFLAGLNYKPIGWREPNYEGPMF